MNRKFKRNQNGGFTVNSQQANFSVAELIEAHTENYNEVLDNIDHYLNLPHDDENALSEEDADDLALQAEEDYQLRIAEALGISVEDLEDEEQYDDDEVEYSANSDWANFSAGTAFGQALLELAETEYEDPLEGLAVIAEETGLSDEQLIGLIQGNFYPTEELASRIGELFDTTADNEDAYNGLLLLAEEAAGDSDDEDEDVTEIEDPEEDAEYSALREEHETLLAQFSQTQAENIVKDSLRDVEMRCQEGISNKWLPPAAMKIMMASFKSENDRLAAFSQVCEENDVDPDTQLFAMNYALEIFSRCGEYGMMFNQYAETPLDSDEIEFQAAQESNVDAALNLFYASHKLPDLNK